MSFSFVQANEGATNSTSSLFGGVAYSNTGSGFGTAGSTNNANPLFGLSSSLHTPCQPGAQVRAEAAAKTTTAPFDELSNALMRLFTTGSYSDLTIKCGDDHYKVHKAIICPRSAFFEAACNSAFKEGRTGEINLPDDDVLAVKMMVHYFYHLDYSVNPAPQAEEQPPMSPICPTTSLSRQIGPSTAGSQAFATINGPASVAVSVKKKSKRRVRTALTQAPGIKPPSDLSVHAKVYALAEKYQITGLKALAVKKFEDEVEDYWESEDFLVAVQEVYTSTMDDDRTMRDVVVATFSRHSCLLDKESVQDVVRDLPVAFDLLMHFRKRHQIR